MRLFSFLVHWTKGHRTYDFAKLTPAIHFLGTSAAGWPAPILLSERNEMKCGHLDGSCDVGADHRQGRNFMSGVK